jgi:protein-tyrosine phosphatase
MKTRPIFTSAILSVIAIISVAFSPFSLSQQPVLPAVSNYESRRVAPTEDLKIPGVKHAGKITDSLYRGGRVTKEGFRELQRLGVTTVVDLHTGHHQIRRERAQVEALGLHFVSIPISGWSPPKNSHVVKFLTLTRQAPAEKVFVHCRFGGDRTGVMIATYRIAMQNWNPEHAIKEMQHFGFHGFWHPAMTTYIRDFPRRFATDPDFAPFRSPDSTAQATPSRSGP